MQNCNTVHSYDPSSIVGDMVFIETIRPQDYTVRSPTRATLDTATHCKIVTLSSGARKLAQVRFQSGRRAGAAAVLPAHCAGKPQTPNPEPQTPNPKPQTPTDTLVQSLAGIVDSGTSCLVFPGHNVHGKKKKKNKQHSIHHTASPLNTTHYMLSNLKAAQRAAGYLKDNPFALFSSASR